MDQAQSMLTEHVEATADLLEDAAQYLEDHGWCQNTMRDRQGRACVLGAINIVGQGLMLGVGTTATLAVTKYLGDRRRPEYVPAWNDAPGRTSDEAIDLLKHTAKALRNSELDIDEPCGRDQMFLDACELLAKMENSKVMLGL